MKVSDRLPLSVPAGRTRLVLHACSAGLSRPLQESEQGVPAGNHVGTIMYTAPEIFRDSRLTKPGDVYAFGIMSKPSFATQCDLTNLTASQQGSLLIVYCTPGGLWHQ